ncbi:MAG TPA: pirin family protein [Gammaproteobacteria bacterium]|nr:pirin family protein [Gammaproteobacteria bacterium]
MKKLSFIQGQDKGHWVGDGFPVRSIFSYHDRGTELSPFLLLDYAGPMDFAPAEPGRRRGVGEHPHRGFETVTIVYSGQVEHRDSTGAGGIIGPGDVQWMTAAGGIVHEEFHGPDFAREGGRFEVIQLWVNLPAKDKLAAPGYQGITDGQIPRAALADGAGTVRVIAGEYGGVRGPARTFTPMDLWDLRLNPGARIELAVPDGQTTAVFVLRGQVELHGGESVGEARLAVFGREGDRLALAASAQTTLLLLSGQPIPEPIAGYGPFVMNTQAEIRRAMTDYSSGRMGRIARPA